MKEIIIAIYCGNSSKEEIEMIQTHFFKEGIEWYSSKFDHENKHKKNITKYLVVERNNLMEADDSVLDGIEDISKVLRFNTPLDYLRYNKIKRIKTNFK